MSQSQEQHAFPAIAGFRMAVPNDRPELLLFELKTTDDEVIRFAMTKDSASAFGQEVQRAAQEYTL